MSEAAFSAEKLTKRYGARPGILDLDLEVRRGEVMGFLGPNGAGKTTTLRLALDLLRPTSGRVRVLGLDPRRDAVELKRRVGYLPGDLALWDRVTGTELLRTASDLRGGVDDRYVAALAKRLDADLSKPARALSRGNKQKLGVLLAFMHEPELAVLDEPTAGLDPLVQQEFHALVREAKADGRSVFLSSHNIPEVERVCDRVAIVRASRLVAVEDVEALRARALRRVEVEFAGPVPRGALAGVAGVTQIEVSGDTVHCSVAGSMDPLVKELARHEVRAVATHEVALEDVFMRFYGGGDGAS